MKSSLSMLSIAALTAATFSLPAAATNFVPNGVNDHPIKTIGACGGKCGGKCGSKCGSKCGGKCGGKK